VKVDKPTALIGLVGCGLIVAASVAYVRLLPAPWRPPAGGSRRAAVTRPRHVDQPLVRVALLAPRPARRVEESERNPFRIETLDPRLAVRQVPKETPHELPPSRATVVEPRWADENAVTRAEPSFGWRVLGTFGPDESPVVALRDEAGDVDVARAGDRVGGATIRRVGPDGIEVDAESRGDGADRVERPIEGSGG